MNKIDDIILKKYYNLREFKKTNELFENYLKKCDIITDEIGNFSDFKISTITSIIKIASNLYLKIF